MRFSSMITAVDAHACGEPGRVITGLVPILGPLVIFLAVLFGLGATAMAVAGGRQPEPAAA